MCLRNRLKGPHESANDLRFCPLPPGGRVGERVLACSPFNIGRLKCDPHPNPLPEGEGAEPGLHSFHRIA